MCPRHVSTVLLQEREDLFKQSAKLRATILKDEQSLEVVDKTVLTKLIDAPAPLETEALLASIYEAKVEMCCDMYCSVVRVETCCDMYCSVVRVEMCCDMYCSVVRAEMCCDMYCSAVRAA